MSVVSSSAVDFHTRAAQCFTSLKSAGFRPCPYSFVAFFRTDAGMAL